MQELILSLQQKTGINNDAAHEAVNQVIESLKSKLPASMHHYLDNAASGQEVRDTTALLFDRFAGTFGH